MLRCFYTEILRGKGAPMEVKIETERKPSYSGNPSKQKVKPLQSSLSMRQRLELDTRFAEHSLWVWRSRREGRSPWDIVGMGL